MPLVLPVPPILPGAALKVITSPTSPTLVVEPVLPEIVTSPTSVVAGVLVSMRTPPRSPTTPHVAAASASKVTPVKQWKLCLQGLLVCQELLRPKMNLWLS